MYEKPFYRLKELIIEKYGAAKFETGCTLVASWINFNTKENTNSDWVQFFCKATGDSPAIYQLSSSQAKALKSLFKLDSYKELYTIPETCPEFFN